MVSPRVHHDLWCRPWCLWGDHLSEVCSCWSNSVIVYESPKSNCLLLSALLLRLYKSSRANRCRSPGIDTVSPCVGRLVRCCAHHAADSGVERHQLVCCHRPYWVIMTFVCSVCTNTPYCCCRGRDKNCKICCMSVTCWNIQRYSYVVHDDIIITVI